MFDHILALYVADNKETFFVVGAAGAGKTFLYNTLCHTIRSHRLWYCVWHIRALLPSCVTFEWNILLDLSGWAATKTFSSLMMELLLQILGQSTWALTVWMIRGDEGVGDIPGVRGVQGGL